MRKIKIKSPSCESAKGIEEVLHGVTVMTAALLDALVDSGWQVVHADTSDHRSIDNIGKFDLENVMLALRHASRFTGMLLRTRPEVVYLPLSQGVAGFTRDAVFLVAARLSAACVIGRPTTR